MVRKLMKLALASTMGFMAVMVAYTGSTLADDKKDLTTKQIMGAGHKGANALFGKVQAALKAKKLEDAVEPAKELAANGSLFPKATPPKDDKKTWATLAGKYADNTKALSEAIEKKDEAAAKKAAGAIGSSCKACHDNHK